MAPLVAARDRLRSGRPAPACGARVHPRSFARFLPPAAPAVLFLFLASVPIGSPEASLLTAASRPAPVVMVVMDELPTTSLLGADGRIDAGRLPNFARLAREGTWYPNMTTVADQTTAAVPALLSGRRSGRSRSARRTWRRGRATCSRCSGSQYRLDVREPVTRLCPARVLPRRVAHDRRRRRRPLASETSNLALLSVAPGDIAPRAPLIGGAGVHDPEEDIADFTDGLRLSEPRPGLHFLHVMAPHRPRAGCHPAGPATGGRRPRGAPIRPAEPAAARAIARCRAGCGARTCSRWAMPTSCSGGCSIGCGPYSACTTTPWWSWRPTTA